MGGISVRHFYDFESQWASLGTSGTSALFFCVQGVIDARGELS